MAGSTGSDFKNKDGTGTKHTGSKHADFNEHETVEFSECHEVWILRDKVSQIIDLPEGEEIWAIRDNYSLIGARLAMGENGTTRTVRCRTYSINGRPLTRETVNIPLAELNDLPCTALLAWRDAESFVSPRDGSHFALYHAIRFFLDDLRNELPITQGRHFFDIQPWREHLINRNTHHTADDFRKFITPK